MPKLPYNPKGRYLVRVLAGGYLLYLAWSLRGEFSRFTLLTLAPVLFAVVGVLFIGTGLRAVARIEAGQEEGADEAAEDPEESEEAPSDGVDE